MSDEYYAQYDETSGNISIRTPDGIELCQVFEGEDILLLQHLNRE